MQRIIYRWNLPVGKAAALVSPFKRDTIFFLTAEVELRMNESLSQLLTVACFESGWSLCTHCGFPHSLGDSVPQTMQKLDRCALTLNRLKKVSGKKMTWTLLASLALVSFISNFVDVTISPAMRQTFSYFSCYVQCVFPYMLTHLLKCTTKVRVTVKCVAPPQDWCPWHWLPPLPRLWPLPRCRTTSWRRASTLWELSRLPQRLCLPQQQQ